MIEYPHFVVAVVASLAGSITLYLCLASLPLSLHALPDAYEASINYIHISTLPVYFQKDQTDCTDRGCISVTRLVLCECESAGCTPLSPLPALSRRQDLKVKPVLGVNKTSQICYPITKQKEFMKAS